MLHVEHRCRCGRDARPGQRKCRECHAEYMRGWRAKRGRGSVLADVTIERDRCCDVFAMNLALELIRQKLDQALKADPLGVTRLHVCLIVEKDRKGDLDP